MGTLRITIEIDQDNEAVQGRWAEHAKNALAALSRRIDSAENFPAIWPPAPGEPLFDGWTEQPITGRLHPRSRERVEIGTYRIEHLDGIEES